MWVPGAPPVVAVSAPAPALPAALAGRAAAPRAAGGTAPSSLPPQTLWPGLKCEGRAGFRRLCVPCACPGSARLPQARSGGQRGPGPPSASDLGAAGPCPEPVGWVLLGCASCWGPAGLCPPPAPLRPHESCVAGTLLGWGAALLPAPPPGLQNPCLGPLLAPKGSRCAPTSGPSKPSPCPLCKWDKALIDACGRTWWLHVLCCLRKSG